jgi:hypothetical protein
MHAGIVVEFMSRRIFLHSLVAALTNYKNIAVAAISRLQPVILFRQQVGAPKQVSWKARNTKRLLLYVCSKIEQCD